MLAKVNVGSVNCQVSTTVHDTCATSITSGVASGFFFIPLLSRRFMYNLLGVVEGASTVVRVAPLLSKWHFLEEHP